MNLLSQFLSKLETKRPKVVVIGDSLIDEYYSVKVNRISPEFPTSILLSDNDKPSNIVPGGAANVCYQMKHWNVDVYLLSVLDDVGAVFLDSHNFDCRYSEIIENGWKMPRKKRFYDGDFPLNRWDVENKDVSQFDTSEWTKVREKILNNLIHLTKISTPDVVILSDYGKGLFTNGSRSLSERIISHCNDHSIPTIVDPKTIKKDLWKHCTILKPNADWTKTFCDKYDINFKKTNDCQEEMKFISNHIKCKAVVLTSSGNGVGVYTEEESKFIPAYNLSKHRPIIRSVIGAGDCFCSMLAVTVALKMSIEDATTIAFNGASIYIEDKHNKPITPYQMNKWFDPIGAKKVSLETLLNIKQQTLNKTWVWIDGDFDNISLDDLSIFEKAKDVGDIVVVGSSNPMLAHLQYVDFVVEITDINKSEVKEFTRIENGR